MRPLRSAPLRLVLFKRDRRRLAPLRFSSDRSSPESRLSERSTGDPFSMSLFTSARLISAVVISGEARSTWRSRSCPRDSEFMVNAQRTTAAHAILSSPALALIPPIVLISVLLYELAAAAEHRRRGIGI